MKTSDKRLFVGLIPDGNRRWEREHKKIPGTGHREGAQRVKEVITAFRDNAYTHILAVWGLSCKNLEQREPAEQELLYVLMEEFLTDLKDNWMDEEENLDVRLLHMGQTDRMLAHAYGKKVVEVLNTVTEHTRDRTGKVVALCLDYDNKSEDARARGMWWVTESKGPIQQHLDLPRQGVPYQPVNLIIRTGSDPVVQHDNEFLLGYRDETRQIHHPYYMPDFYGDSFNADVDEYLNAPKRLGK